MLILSKKKIERFCVIICAFNEGSRISEIVRKTVKNCQNVVVVDDGSSDDTAKCAAEAGAEVLRLASNQGKDKALNQGFCYARNLGFDAVITMDGDGRHDPNDIPKFIETYERTGFPFLAGNRMHRPCDLRVARRWVNRAMAAWLCKISGVYIPDPPCGFRFYRGDVLPYIIAQDTRHCVEFEMLMNIVQRKIRIDSVRITHIPGHGGSKLVPWRDILRFCRVVKAHHKRELLLERERLKQEKFWDV